MGVGSDGAGARERGSSWFRVLGHQLAHIEKEKVGGVRSIRAATVSTLLPLLAWVVGIPEAMIPLGVGALFAGIAESNIHPAHRGRVLLWTTAWLVGTCAVGFLVAPSALLVVITSALVGAAAGWVGVAGPRAGVVGVLSLVLFTITSGLPEAIGLYSSFMFYVGLGSLVQSVVFIVTYRVWPGNPGPPPEREPHTLWFRVFHPGEQKSVYLRHSLNVAVAIVLATAFSQYLDVPHEYWIPMTVAWIFKPSQKSTSLRVVERVTGTVLAIGLAYLWGTFVPAPEPVLFVLCGLGAYLVLAFLTSNYSIATFGVTTFVLAIFAIAGDLNEETVIFRLLSTLCAGAIVILVVFVTRLGTYTLRRTS